MKRSTALIVLLSLGSVSEGQELPELLTGVGADKARRLVGYNSVFVQKHAYLAKRYRIVTADTDLLLEDKDFTITPFEDLSPIRLSQEGVQRYEDSVFWNGLLDIELPEPLEALGMKPQAEISMVVWDTDEQGHAFVSSENRFEHSRYWRFDQFDRPILDAPVGENALVGPPPRTPEEIARHKELKGLEKRAFYSVSAILEVSPETKYVLVPLEHTPKYSLIYEEDPEKRVPVRIDFEPPGQTPNRTPDELAKLREYQNFVRNLPEQQNVPVVEEIP